MGSFREITTVGRDPNENYQNDYNQWGRWAEGSEGADRVWQQESCEERADRELKPMIGQIQNLRDRISRIQRESLTLGTQTGGGEYQRTFRKQHLDEEVARLNAQITMKQADMAEQRAHKVDACELERRTTTYKIPTSRARPQDMDSALMGFAMEGS